jgi:hypothetical protein
MEGAARDLMLMSLADYHIISKTSGFGQKAAFLNRKPHRNHIFYPEVERHKETDRIEDSYDICRIDSYTNPRFIAETWSGV